MATLLVNHFEGQADGSAVTPANSGATGDDPFAVVSATGGAALAYSNAWAAHGTGSLSLTNQIVGSVGLVGYAGYSASSMTSRFYAAFQGPPTSADLIFAQFRSATGPLFSLRYKMDGTIGVDMPNGTTLDSSTYTLPINQKLRFEWSANISPTAGGVIADVYTLDSTTSLGRIGQLTVDSGSTLLAAARWGKINSTSAIASWRIDDIAVKDAQTTYLGPYVPPASGPAITATADSDVWLIKASGADTYTISPSAGVTQHAPGVFTGKTAGTYTITGTATSTGLTGTAQATVTDPTSVPTGGGTTTTVSLTETVVRVGGVWT